MGTQVAYARLDTNKFAGLSPMAQVWRNWNQAGLTYNQQGSITNEHDQGNPQGTQRICVEAFLHFSDTHSTLRCPLRVWLFVIVFFSCVGINSSLAQVEFATRLPSIPCLLQPDPERSGGGIITGAHNIYLQRHRQCWLAFCIQRRLLHST